MYRSATRSNTVTARAWLVRLGLRIQASSPSLMSLTWMDPALVSTLLRVHWTELFWA